MPVASVIVERSFSVLRGLKDYVRSTIKNVRLSSLGLVDIHRHFEGRFWTILRNSVIKIVLDSMLYETLKWPQIAPFCISSKQNPRPLPLSRIMTCTLLTLSYAPGYPVTNEI
jgi:hypothetical protein